MTRTLLALACLVVCVRSAQAQTTLFECAFQDSAPFLCTDLSATNPNFVEHGATSGTCGTASVRWQTDWVSSGGYDNRAYWKQTFCTQAEHGGSGEFPSGYDFSSPAGLDGSWAGVTTFYGQFRLYAETAIDAGAGGAIRTLKWFMAHQGVYGGDQRIIVFLERGDVLTGCSATADIVVAVARNIFSGSGPANLGNAARACIPIGEWRHLQFSWKHGVNGVSFVKIWDGNNVEASPTDDDTSLDDVPADPGGTSEWVRDNAGYQGDWSLGGASNTGTQFAARFIVRVMDFAITDGFVGDFAPTGAPPPATYSHSRMRKQIR